MRNLILDILVVNMLLGVAALALASPSNAQYVITVYPTDDTWIWMENPNDNRGSDAYMGVRNIDGAGGGDVWEKDALVKFDLSLIPPGSGISSATLHLYYHYCSFSNCAGRDLKSYMITSTWDEATVTWNTQPGVESVATDHSVVPSSFDWMTWDVTDDVQAMVNGEEDNEGWEIKDDVAWGTSNIPDSRFRTKEYGDYIPYLEIEITIEPAPIPSLSEWGIIIVCIFLLGSPFWVVRSHRHRSTRRISG